MADKHDRERFIPFRKADIIDMCIKDSRLAEDEKKQFCEFAQILDALFHFEFHQRLETLKSGRRVRWSIDVDPLEMF